MSAILGQYGALVWQYFPESRDVVKHLVSDELQDAIDDERQPEDITVYEYTIHAVNPFIKHLHDTASTSGDLIQRFCRFCRALLAYSGPDAREVDYNFNVTILEYTDIPGTATAVRAVDPELVDLIQARYGKWK